MPAYGIICENGEEIWKDKDGNKFHSREEAKNYAEAEKYEYVNIINGTEKNILLQRKISDLHKK